MLDVLAQLYNYREFIINYCSLLMSIQFNTNILLTVSLDYSMWLFSKKYIMILHQQNVLQYSLELSVTDGESISYATLVVRVLDVNDNPPVFEKSSYRTQVTEEDDRNLPKRILQVKSVLFVHQYSRPKPCIACNIS